MFDHHDLGASLYRTWSPEQRREEIAKLVEGYRAGVPVGILCKMAETIAGSRKGARKHLHAMLTLQERQAAVGQATGGMESIARQFLL
jgi:hypothetical protein